MAVMDLIGGPQGSGKSSFFPVSRRGYDGFNIDEHRRTLNKGSSQDVPAAIRELAIADYQSFIEQHIAEAKSFSIEVTLGKEITFVQAARAKAAGFYIQLVYIAADLEECLRRVAGRLHLKQHGVSPDVIRETYNQSMRNLPRALREFHLVQVYDNSHPARADDTDDQIMPKLALETVMGAITLRTASAPSWLLNSLISTEFAP